MNLCSEILDSIALNDKERQSIDVFQKKLQDEESFNSLNSHVLSSSDVNSDVDMSRIVEACFPDISDSAKSGFMSLELAEEIACRVTLKTFPSAILIYLFGSAARGSFKAFSDIDVIAVVGEGSAWTKTCTVFEGYAVELQAIRKDSLAAMAQFARQSGQALAVAPLATGRLVYGDSELGRRIGDQFRKVLDGGPDEFSAQTFTVMRAALSSRIVELATNPSHAEAVSCAMSMYEPLNQLIMMHKRMWIRSDKWIPRMLADEPLYVSLMAAYDALHGGSRSEFVKAVANILDLVGGPLWDGYQRDFWPDRSAG